MQNFNPWINNLSTTFLTHSSHNYLEDFGRTNEVSSAEEGALEPHKFRFSLEPHEFRFSRKTKVLLDEAGRPGRYLVSWVVTSVRRVQYKYPSAMFNMRLKAHTVLRHIVLIRHMLT
jgi:hypothetical protein